MLSPSWPKCVAQLSVAQLVCRPDDRTPLSHVTAMFVNIPFSDEKNYICLNDTPHRICRQNFNSWNEQSLHRLLKTYRHQFSWQACRERQTMNREHWGEYHRVGDFILSQEGAPQTHQSVLKISRNTGICQSSIIIDDRLPKNNKLYRREAAKLCPRSKVDRQRLALGGGVDYVVVLIS